MDLPYVETPDGRWLAFESTGPDDGVPVVLCHGMPGSKAGPRPRPMRLHSLGIRLISYDRPGYGGSTRKQGRSVADAAADVAAIADQLELAKFAVVGRSGGGPHALACAELLGNRVTRTAVLVSIAPATADGLDWSDGMAPSNVEAYEQAKTEEALIQTLTARAEAMRDDPETMLNFLKPQMGERDWAIVDDMRRQLHEAYREAVQGGPGGWIDDVLAFRKPWGFALTGIKTPVRLWHGDDDTFSPVSHSRWLKDRLPTAELEVQVGKGHFAAMETLPRMLQWCVGQAEQTEFALGPSAGAA
ncbi:alpha/beta hydrolase [Catellatospora citrea]|uniref:Alpha/beta hydrolase n=2 Tax=Catellatospora citrea TaxID=53366 RepID=A0A8J3P1R0_9ACTN|nr:pimeloyl-ACP methyl ester carboxylesterase [Catellatospora citrea]GIF98600.1 alpha/beta hydrolase [Catellatospora citrea]